MSISNVLVFLAVLVAAAPALAVDGDHSGKARVVEKALQASKTGDEASFANLVGEDPLFFSDEGGAEVSMPLTASALRSYAHCKLMGGESSQNFYYAELDCSGRSKFATFTFAFQSTKLTGVTVLAALNPEN